MTVWAAAVGLAGGQAPVHAQTDYYNTDHGRPLQVEDAYPVERHAFEVQIAPLRLERVQGEAYRWELEPEIAYGILPRTHVELGLPFRLVDAEGGGGAAGRTGINLSALHNLNAETRTLPALAVAADVALPLGSLAGEHAYSTVRAIATRTFPWARLHANGQYTIRATPAGGEVAGEASRWMAGVAADRTFPLRSLLATAGVVAEQPLPGDDGLEWTAEAGLRYQTSPQFNLDLGVGHRFTGDERGWFFTFGVAHAFAARSLIPTL